MRDPITQFFPLNPIKTVLKIKPIKPRFFPTLDQGERRPVLAGPHLHELLLPDPTQPQPSGLLRPPGPARLARLRDLREPRGGASLPFLHLPSFQERLDLQRLLANNISNYSHFHRQSQVRQNFKDTKTHPVSFYHSSFLNWLTVAPSIWYFDDRFLSSLFSKSARSKILKLQKDSEILREKKQRVTPLWRNILSGAVGIVIAYLSIPIVINLASPTQVMNRSFDPLRIVNTYGAFGR